MLDPATVTAVLAPALPYLLRTGLFPAERKNPLDLDLRIKRSFPLGSGYEGRIADLLGISEGPHSTS